MMDEVDNLGFVAMSVLGVLIVSELVSIEVTLGLFLPSASLPDSFAIHAVESGGRPDGCCFHFSFPRFRSLTADRSPSACFSA
ncbi:hypothetical protein [Haladaptatus pallidirubidus]|uniref:hypothetical protein n=1 Tax=Haladaptatus pallidirubidus TaxID=1008152 RepID=UPI001D122632|nr:hypothetical protein [Haladaptatus pallidirubidus]